MTTEKHTTEPEPYVTYGHLQKFGDGLESRIDKKIDTMGASLASAIGDLKSSFSSAIEAKNRPMNPGWIFGGFGALGVLFGLWVNPVADRASMNQARGSENAAAIARLTVDQFTRDDADRMLANMVDRIQDQGAAILSLKAGVTDRNLKIEYWRGVNDQKIQALERAVAGPGDPITPPSMPRFPLPGVD